MRYYNRTNKGVGEEMILDTDELFPLLTRVQLVALRAEIEIAIMMRG